MNPRPLRPRATAALVVAPVAVTDRTCAAVLGLEPRVFRELVARLRIRHATIGRRVIASVADVLAALERAAVDDDAHLIEHDGADEHDAPGSVDELLARLGRKHRTA